MDTWNMFDVRTSDMSGVSANALCLNCTFYWFILNTIHLHSNSLHCHKLFNIVYIYIILSLLFNKMQSEDIDITMTTSYLDTDNKNDATATEDSQCPDHSSWFASFNQDVDALRICTFIPKERQIPGKLQWNEYVFLSFYVAVRIAKFILTDFCACVHVCMCTVIII